MTLHVVLHQPKIPPNTGNIIRLCANTGAQLHLIHPLGFDWDDKRLRRAGLDYHMLSCVTHYASTGLFLKQHAQRRIFALTTKATQSYHTVDYHDEDMLLFGSETSGLPESLRTRWEAITIPMQSTSRSLNLSNAVAVVLYEAWRQTGFATG